MSKNDKELVKKGKYLSFLLRHDTEYTFDKNGYREVSDLIKNHGYTRSELEEIVSTNDKQRYEFNKYHTKIRARQGSPVILEVNTKQMTIDGIKFYLSNNNVWLTDYVSPDYIKQHN